MKITTKKSLLKSLSENIKILLSSALGLVAALAWNEAIKELIKIIFPEGSASSLIFKFLYAIAITLFAVGFIFYLSRLEEILKQKLGGKQSIKNLKNKNKK